MLVSVSRRGWVYHGPVERRDERDAIVQVERLGQVRLAAVQVDRALVHRRERALLLEHAEQRAGARSTTAIASAEPERSETPPGGRAGAAPGQARRRAHQLAGLDERLGRAQRARAQHVVIGLGERQLVRGGAQVADADLGVRRIEDRGLVGASEERVGVVDEVAVERVGARARAAPGPRRGGPARPHCWRRLATVPGNPIASAQSSSPTSTPSSSASVATTPSSRPETRSPSMRRRSSAV